MEPDDDEKRQMAERAAAIEARYAASAQQASPEATGQAPPDVHVRDEGGEASMSISDTNKLRLSLGLKPLVDTSAQQEDAAIAEHRRHRDAQAGKQKAQDEKAVRERLATAKERRRLDAQIKKTKALGSYDEHADDVGVCARSILMLLASAMCGALFLCYETCR